MSNEFSRIVILIEMGFEILQMQRKRKATIAKKAFDI